MKHLSNSFECNARAPYQKDTRSFSSSNQQNGGHNRDFNSLQVKTMVKVNHYTVSYTEGWISTTRVVIHPPNR